jgi:hypothetical protein
MAHELLEGACVLALVLVDRQQQIESAIVAPHGSEHRPLEIHPVLEAVEHRAQEAREHRAAVAAALIVVEVELDHERAERGSVRGSQARHERRRAVDGILDSAASRNGIGCAQLVEQLAQLRTLVAVGAPDELAGRVVNRDAACARQQHLHELTVRRVAALIRHGGRVFRGRRSGRLWH